MKRPILLPLVPLYSACLALREFGHRRGWERTRWLSYPVISIGNLSTGGSGKTPLAITLARLLSARGFHVDVLSRGYGRRGREPARVKPDGTAEEFGDERADGEQVFAADGFSSCIFQGEFRGLRADGEDAVFNAACEEVFYGALADGEAISLHKLAGVGGDFVELVLKAGHSLVERHVQC